MNIILPIEQELHHLNKNINILKNRDGMFFINKLQKDISQVEKMQNLNCILSSLIILNAGLDNETKYLESVELDDGESEIVQRLRKQAQDIFYD